MKHALILFCLVLPVGCDRSADDYPRLLPTARILAEPTLPDHAPDAALSPAPVKTAVDARAAALRQRAEALRGPVIEPEILARMQQAN